MEDPQPRAVIVAAAREVLRRDRQGTVEELAHAAGVSRATVYRLLSRPLLERELGYDVPVEDTVQQLAENWVRSMRPE